MSDHVSELRRLIVRHRNVAPMVSALLAGTDASVTIRDADGSVILDRAAGARDGTERHDITVDRDTVGSVEGGRAARAIASVLAMPRLASATSGASRTRPSSATASCRSIYDLADAIGAAKGRGDRRRSRGPSWRACRATRRRSCARGRPVGRSASDRRDRGRGAIRAARCRRGDPGRRAGARRDRSRRRRGGGTAGHGCGTGYRSFVVAPLRADGRTSASWAPRPRRPPRSGRPISRSSRRSPR